MRFPFISVKHYDREQEFHVQQEVELVERIRELEAELEALRKAENDDQR